MKLYFEVLPVIEAALVDIAVTKGVDAETLTKRFTNVMFAELGKINAERKEAKDGRKAGLWASLKVKKGAFSGSQKQTQNLMLEDGQTISTRVVDVYRFSAATVKFEEEFGAELVSQIPPSISNWIEGLADKLKEKAEEKVTA